MEMKRTQTRLVRSEGESGKGGTGRKTTQVYGDKIAENITGGK